MFWTWRSSKSRSLTWSLANWGRIMARECSQDFPSCEKIPFPKRGKKLPRLTGPRSRHSQWLTFTNALSFDKCWK
jgi:hypothetical protein